MSKICLQPRATGLTPGWEKVPPAPILPISLFLREVRSSRELAGGSSLTASHCSVSQQGCEGGWWRDNSKEVNGYLLCLDRTALLRESLIAQPPRALFTFSVVSLFHRQCTSPALSLNLSNSSHVPCSTASCHSWELTSLALAHEGDINWSFTFNLNKEEF